MNNKGRQNILILDSGTQGLSISKDLRKGGYNVIMLVRHRHCYGDDSKYVNKVVLTHHAITSKEYLKDVFDLISKYSIIAIIPMGDEAAKFLSKNKTILLPLVKYELPDIEIFSKGYDKNSLMETCQIGGYPHPQTYTGIKDLTSIPKESLRFPLLIKPNITFGARGMTLVNDYDELTRLYPEIKKKYGECHLQTYVKPGGKQVEFQLYIDRHGNLVNYSVISKFRWYPEKGGSSCCAESVDNKEFVDILHRLLKDIGWVGFADFDTIEDPDTHELLIMELNPRVPACVKAAQISGINWGEIIINEYLGKPQKKYTYKTERILRHLGFDTLWFIQSENRFKTKPSFFNFWGKNIKYQDFEFSDPLPFIKGTWENFKSILTTDVLKEKNVKR